MSDYPGRETLTQGRVTRRDRAARRGSFIVDRRGTILGFDLGMESLTGWPAMEVVGQNKDQARIRTDAEGEERPGGSLPLYAGSISIPADSQRLELRLNCRDGRSVDVEAVAARLKGGGDRITVTVHRVLARSASTAAERDFEQRDSLTDLSGQDAFVRRLQGCLRSAAAIGGGPPAVPAARGHPRPADRRLGPPGGADGGGQPPRRPPEVGASGGLVAPPRGGPPRPVAGGGGRRGGDPGRTEVLRRQARILRGPVEDEDLVARLRDDDFAMVLVGSGRGEARQVAARLRSTVERFRFFGFREGEQPVPVTLSLGAASFPADADNAADLLGRAREALEEARSFGRNRVWCYLRRPRVPVQVPVYFDGVESTLLGFSLDLSPSGLFVQTRTSIDIGMRCALAFPLPGTDGNVHVIGRVVRSVPPEPASPGEARVPGMGIEFDRLGPTDRRTLETFLHQHESSTLRPENGTFSL